MDDKSLKYLSASNEIGFVAENDRDFGIRKNFRHEYSRVVKRSECDFRILWNNYTYLNPF